jgi:glycosyltransferase involved in cell wall biosynthesis
MPPAAVTIAICTRERPESLRATLETLARCAPLPAHPAEVLVIDNGLDGATRALVSAWTPGSFRVRWLPEPRPGVARARNAALAAARGDVILFLDDDVRPPAGWLAAMCEPVLSGTADAVAGGVRLAPHLERPWMRPVHRAWLAETSYIDAERPQEMVSANMAIGRHVLARVPGFDPELGPGALGQGEDALFSWQLLRAGFRIAPALQVSVEHHFDPRRLSRTGFREAAERRGRTMAYLGYHWRHDEPPDAARRLRRRSVRFLLGRVAAPGRSREGMSPWELHEREQLACLRHWCRLRGQPRNYDRLGLVKRRGERSAG